MDVCACICLMHEVDFGDKWQLAAGPVQPAWADQGIGRHGMVHVLGL